MVPFLPTHRKKNNGSNSKLEKEMKMAEGTNKQHERKNKQTNRKEM